MISDIKAKARVKGTHFTQARLYEQIFMPGPNKRGIYQWQTTPDRYGALMVLLSYIFRLADFKW